MIPSRPMSRGFFAVTLLLLTALVATPGRTEVVNRIVATIDGDPITAHELQRFVESKGEKAKNAPEKQVLEALITERLLDKEIQAQGIVVKDEEIDAYVGAIKTQNHLDDAGFVKALAGQGLTLKSYRERIKGELEKTQLVNREIRSRVTVSPEEIQRYYDEHKSEFATGEGATVRDIFFAIPPGPTPRRSRRSVRAPARSATRRRGAAISRRWRSSTRRGQARTRAA